MVTDTPADSEPADSELCELGPNCLRPLDNPRLGNDARVSWVCCDDCSRWYHDACIGRTPTTADDTPFHCGCIFNTADGGKRGPCSKCHQIFALVGSGATLRLSRHGPRKAPCQGSGQSPDFRPPPVDFSPLRSTLAEPPATVEATDLLWPGQTIRSLPTALVPLAAESLTKALQGVCNAPNSTNAWIDLITWAKRRLIAPSSRLGRAALKRLLREQLSGDGAARQEPTPPPVRRNHALAKAVRSRVDVGDIRGASRIVVNDGKVVRPDQESFEALLTKHPPCADPAPAAGELAPPLTLTLEQLLSAVDRTPAGGAPGPDGMRPLALKQLTGPRAGPARQPLQLALLDFCNLVLAGAVPPAIRHVFFGANLIAFRKKDGGLRPIAIGLALRRLAGRAACATLQQQVANFLAPIQLGLGVRGGAEAAVHGTRRFLEAATGEAGVVKLDFSNAFNAVSRTAVLDAVRTHFPQLERFTRCAYGAASTLRFGDFTIPSASGVQQGDPIGPLLFALAVRDISHAGKSDLNVWYLDDATIGGPTDQVLAEIDRIRREAALIGLSLNCNKCEAISDDADFLASVQDALPGCRLIAPSDGDLLGAAVGESAVLASLSKRTEQLRNNATRLASIERHDALALLRISLGHPKAVYELRAGASFRAPQAVANYDLALRETMEQVLNVKFNDQAWLQCTLPPALGGIGVRTPSDLALPAYLSSVASTQSLADSICRDAPDLLPPVARHEWQVLCNMAQPPDPAHHARARSWQRPLDAGKRQRLLTALRTDRDVARLHSASTPEAAAVYRGLPCSRDGTRLTNVELPIVVGLRLGLPVAAAGVCQCGAPLDALGDHALTCNRGVERMRRHDELNARLRDTLGEAGFPAILEPAGLTRHDQRRFDGTTVAAFERGRPLAWDATVIHTCAPSHLPASAVAARAATAAAEAKKTAKYVDLSDRFDFRPFAVETLGAFGASALDLVDSLASRIHSQTGEQGVRGRIFRRLSTAVQAGNARRIVEAHSQASSGRFRPFT